MSVFREVKELHLLDAAEPLKTKGSTCLCYKIKVYDRWQFIKRLRPEFEHNTRYISLFTKEFMVGSRLNHPNIVRYNELQTTDEGLFMMLDYVEGNTLADILEHNTEYFTRPAHLERFCIQLLSGLEYLHSQQILHLDLKPENIMITRVNEDVKILDLGFCRTDCYTDSEGKSLGFSAPEQDDSNSSMLVDARTDLYTFGRLLEEIEKHLAIIGYNLPLKYARLKKDCLRTRPNDRPQHASDCIKRLKGSARTQSLLHAIFTICVIFLVTFCFSMLHEPTRENVLYALRDFTLKDYQWKNHGCELRILSEEDKTCMMRGWESTPQNRKHLIIPSASVYRRRLYHISIIADSALQNNLNLETVYIPNSVKSIGSAAFRNCRNLKIANLSNSVKTLGEEAFSGCSSLHLLKISSAMEEISPRAFQNCTNLESINIPAGIGTLCMDCFAECYKLSFVKLPSTLKVIERGSFYECSSLKTVILPDSLEELDEYSFFRCDSLTDVICLAERPPRMASAFDRRNIRIHVPKKSVDLYKNHREWSVLQIVEINQEKES